MAGDRLAAHQKKARRQGAHLALLDESGVMMAPLVRRGWAPRGHPPVLDQCGSHQKVSVAAALWLSPLRDRLGLDFHTLVNDYFENWSVTAFLEALFQDVAGRCWRRAHDESERNGDEVVNTQRINRVSSFGLILLSLIALLVVLWGYTQPPLPDEGTGAHIFQLSIVALLPMALLFVTTADWSQPWRSARPAAVAAAATVLAFAALYYLEHVYYPGQLR